MDIDFWASKVHPSKHFTTTMQTTRLNSEHHLGFDNSEGDDDLRAYFPCPFCYVDIELPSLCIHLQEEHCFDLKNAVCPVCASNLGKDIMGHFMLQHSSSLKRRRKSQRSGLWTNSSAMLGKELRDLTSFLGVNSAKGGSSIVDSIPDPVFSPFLCTVAPPESKDSPDMSSSIVDVKSSEGSTSDEAQEEDQKEKLQRAEFIQQLVLSTIF
ncbi:hypothetical protein AQUCO_05600001v1 [Aquilegia coerulea]|uniref:Drought induced 19 protein type zinc-binding domain-containing protein n=1 Tax=Aquilegia coerulea TaxID=218851 RepID=A0A2G5CG56_AQUCA|nr:hypothetical protein AQUCO_05600001v1 [Aquilegia coerulea]